MYIHYNMTDLYHFWSGAYRSSWSQKFFKIGVLKNFTIFQGKHLCWSFFLIKLQTWTTLLKETPTQVFSCEYCEIFRNSFFHRTPPVAASLLVQERFIDVLWYVCTIKRCFNDFLNSYHCINKFFVENHTKKALQTVTWRNCKSRPR